MVDDAYREVARDPANILESYFDEYAPFRSTCLAEQRVLCMPWFGCQWAGYTIQSRESGWLFEN